jgi:hypothetical protein
MLMQSLKQSKREPKNLKKWNQKRDF